MIVSGIEYDTIVDLTSNELELHKTGFEGIKLKIFYIRNP